LLQLRDRFFRALEDLIEDREDTLLHFKQRVKNLDPATILKKGFAIIKSNNKIVTDPNNININSELQTILKNETIYSTVNKKSKNEK
jgi:exodeoxyribonuclease VII large subunit